MSWVKLIVLVLGLIDKWTDHARDKGLISQGQDQEIAKATASILAKTEYAKMSERKSLLWTMRLLTLPCAILSLSSCTVKPLVTDSFCEVYEPVIQAKGDGAIQAPSGTKRRILGNEQTYRGLCKDGNAK